jgi:biopolymer transport protein ExbD
MSRQLVKRQGSSDEADINLTPMLDVVFIMLIFFIVTATFIKQTGVQVTKPDAETAEKKPTISMLFVRISSDFMPKIRKGVWLFKQIKSPRTKN